MKDLYPGARGSAETFCYTMGDGPFDDGEVATGLNLMRTSRELATVGQSMRLETMPKQPFQTSASYLESIRGLHRLHELALAGMNESPEADAVRASLERPWNCLSNAERERIKGLSEDLDSLIEVPIQNLPVTDDAQRAFNEVMEARHAGEWDRALALLRRIEPCFLAAQVMSLRGMIWREAGDPATAAVFLNRAAEVAPSVPTPTGR